MGCHCSKKKGKYEDTLEEIPAIAGKPPAPQSSVISFAVADELREILDKMQDNSTEFVMNLDTFFRNKREILAVYAKAAPAGLLEGIEIVATGIKAEGDDYKPECRQQNLAGTGAVESIAELREVAAVCKPHFDTMVIAIGAAVGGTIKLKIPGLKEGDRIAPKARDDYSDRSPGPAVAWVYDVVRMRFVCGTAQDIIKVLAALKVDERIIAILAAKNRFKFKTANGFCDLLLQVLFRADLGNGKFVDHVCEIQIHLGVVTEYADSHGSHESYSYFRKFFSGSMETVAARLDDMEEVIGTNFNATRHAETAFDVLKQLVGDVVESGDCKRMQALSDMCREYLQEFDLGIFVGSRKLDVQLQSLEPSHPDVASTQVHIADLLKQRGSFDEAEVILDKVLAGQLSNKAIGKDHLDVAKTYHLLGKVYISQKRLDEAVGVTKKALPIQLKANGGSEMHPDIADLYHVMGMGLEMSTKYEEALVVYMKLIDIRVAVLGPNHQKVATAYNNTAITMKKLERWDEAYDFYTKALHIKKRIWGEHHASVSNTLIGIGTILKQQGKNEEALELFEQSLEIKLKVQPETHPHVIQTRGRHLAGMLNEMGRFEEATAMKEKARAAQIEKFGPASQEVAQTNFELAKWAERDENYKRSLTLFTKALEAFEAHSKDTVVYIGEVRSQTDDTKEAKEAIARVQARL